MPATRRGLSSLGGDDRVHRSDLDRTLDAVHAVELGGDLGQLLGPHRRPQLGQLGAELGALRTAGLGHPRVQLQDPRVAGRPRG